MNRILVIQTSFIGDVILATALVEQLGKAYPNAKIDFLLRKGNEGLLENNPHLNEVLIWNKKEGKYEQLLNLLRKIRRKDYDLVLNLQRFASTGLLTAFSGAKMKIGFNKNPFSFLYSKSLPHEFGTVETPIHEVERNASLIKSLFESNFSRPKLYPSDEDFAKVNINEEYVCMAPASVWFTKQLPFEKWVELINSIPEKVKIKLLGGKVDKPLCNKIIESAEHKNIENLAGKLTFLESAALMKGSKMNYVNDSAPLHIASAMNAPITAFFCSTVPKFGFTPLSDVSIIKEVEGGLDCRPCGLHGKRACPKGHFKCGDIDLIN